MQPSPFAKQNWGCKCCVGQVMTCTAIDKAAGFNIFFKCEMFQKG